MNAKQHIIDRTTNATVKVDTELYQRVTKKFNYGDITTLFRAIFTAIDQIIQEGKLIEIINYMYGREDLLLKVPKKKGKQK